MENSIFNFVDMMEETKIGEQIVKQKKGNNKND